jgi:diguanylate cyclase (GGDEF)-like protein
MNQFVETMRRQVLVVDDEPVNRQMLGLVLETNYEVLYAENGLEALTLLREHSETIALIMLDLLMPEMDGYEFLKIRQQEEKLRLIPVIVLTSEKESELKTLKLGASDFLKKPYDMPEIILARADRLVELTENRRVIRSTERESLTGLYTKQYFFEYVKQRELYYPDRQMDVCALNIEKFHLVNDVFGREFGDRILKTVADVVRAYLKEHEGIACRSDADWYYLYMGHVDDYGKMLSLLQRQMDEQVSELPIRLRLGVFSDRMSALDIERRCDQAKNACDSIRDVYTQPVALYDAKMHEASIFSMRLINEVEAAIEEGQLQVFYQPKFDVTGGKPVLKSAEALVRWKHPELGMISPGVFIPLFEKNGLIQKVDFYVWRKAGEQVRAWKERYGVSIPVSVNISRVDLYDPLLETKLTGILDEYSLTSDEYYLEVTESAYVEDPLHIVEEVTKLRQLGFKIEMDDFGSGYSSLNMLTSLPVDVLKLDMKLVSDIHTDPKALHIVEAVLDIAHFMSLTVVAEGVEKKEQYELLRSCGCEIVQGWYFAKPVPAEEFVPYIEELLDRKE